MKVTVPADLLEMTEALLARRCLAFLGLARGAGAVVTKDITVPGTYLGNPARLSRKF